MRDLEGRAALVTGGARGSGRAICASLGARGARVVVNYTSDETAANETAAAVSGAGGSAATRRFDVSDSAAVDEAIKEVSADGGLHILVNNAGVARDGLTLGAKDADWKRALDVNLSGAFHCTRAALRSLLKAKDAGRIFFFFFFSL